MSTLTVQSLSNKAQDPSAKFTRLLLRFGDKSKVYCSVEGQDMQYYLNLVELWTHRDVRQIECHNKKGVLEFYDYMASLLAKGRFEGYALLFFVDRDFDDNSSVSPEVCVTEGYSIENYYMTDECVSKMLEYGFGLDPILDQAKHDACMNLYRTKLEEYHNAAILFNAWYSCLHVMGTSVAKARINLGENFPKGWIRFDFDNGIVSNYDITHIENKYTDAPSVDQDRILAETTRLLSDPRMLLRGKYELEFLSKFIEYLEKDAKNSKTYTKKRSSLVHKDNILANLSKYAHRPQSLADYIKGRAGCA